MLWVLQCGYEQTAGVGVDGVRVVWMILERKLSTGSLLHSGVQYESRMYTTLQCEHGAAGEEGKRDAHGTWYTRVLSKAAV